MTCKLGRYRGRMGALRWHEHCAALSHISTANLGHPEEERRGISPSEALSRMALAWVTLGEILPPCGRQDDL